MNRNLNSVTLQQARVEILKFCLHASNFNFSSSNYFGNRNLGPCPAGLRYIPVVWDFSVHDLNCACKLGTVHAWLDSINQSAFPYPGQIQSITK